jgi:hypothetical protein
MRLKIYKMKTTSFETKFVSLKKKQPNSKQNSSKLKKQMLANEFSSTNNLRPSFEFHNRIKKVLFLEISEFK